ncbi:hypothetical protein ES332_D12G306600v1 [Gossypium tomentosum]|uniref:Alcohol dehydrogenase-like C-terminal domain-containing protein n=1 Tax=Gossypium tomentosum TaxID=34277 RepID=A0A5D2IGR2_GOSTO|nr:hypothetical protein ES332_D12G306600v1 [Gossypium tomentosum]
MSKGGKSDQEDGEENMVAWLVGLNTLKIQPFKLPPLGPHDVRVGMKAVGICGSDVHFFKIVHPAYLCFKLPDNVSLEEGALCQPLSVAVHACRRGNISPETNVLVMGAGSIGLVTLLAARAFGAPRIVTVDVDGNRLSVAKELGADGVVEVSTNMQDIPKEVETICNVMGAKVDVSFDCAGLSKTMSTALSVTRAGGKVCLVGLGHNEMTVPLTPAAAREVDVIGVFRYKNTWPLCIELLRSGKIDVKPLITHRFGFSQKEIEEAFETSAGGGNAIKVMFNL